MRINSRRNKVDTNKHYTSHQLSAYLFTSLGRVATFALEEHVFDCGECTKRLHEVIEYAQGSNKESLEQKIAGKAHLGRGVIYILNTDLLDLPVDWFLWPDDQADKMNSHIKSCSECLVVQKQIKESISRIRSAVSV